MSFLCVYMNLKRILLASIFILNGTFAVGGEVFSLKEYKLRQSIAGCPKADTKVMPDGITRCFYGKTTLANQSVDGVYIDSFDGKITSVVFNLSKAGEDGAKHAQMYQALVEKYGRPRIDKYGVAMWGDGTDVLAVGDSSVMLVDRKAEAKISKAYALKNKSNL